jgi:carboxyl-terminal processing protease
MLAAALGGMARVHADLAGPTAEDRRITLAVTNYMRDGHITRHELNDEIAERMMDNFLKTLDAQKVFFYQSDIDEFKKHTTELDDQVRRGTVDFAFQVFGVFL